MVEQYNKGIKKTSHRSVRFFLSLWSWRGSNPRPNRRQKGFLHAYPVIDCRELSRKQASKTTPYLLFLAVVTKLTTTTPELLPPPDRTGTGSVHPGDVPLQHLVSELGSFYCRKIKLQEQSYLRQLFGRGSVLRVNPPSPACLHNHLICCQYHVSPKQGCKYTTNEGKVQENL